ncbi:MAG: bifunctional riboflavin kinase/FAD synthetase [Ruminococcaceae bacterium]|nr:bifunctional riboflavin kinase/FAD synthetase [Oscillospiraceae bacterium]
MNIILIDSNIEIKNNDKYAVCLGMFDGVHKGHRELILETKRLAKENNIKSSVLTFLTPTEKNKIYPFEENLKILENLGIDTVFAVNFTDEFKNYSPKHFIDKYLIEYIKASFVVCGYNFRFGKDRMGDINTLKNESMGAYSLTVIPEVKVNEETVSSTLIKEYIKQGAIDKVNLLLGEPYRVSGVVLEGKKLGRQINFPTINMPVEKYVTLLKPGVYSSKVLLGDKMYNSISNIGTSPTVSKKNEVIAETYIMDFTGDLYNKYMKVYFLGFIRDEKKFENLEELKNTIKLNLDTAKKQLKESELYEY